MTFARFLILMLMGSGIAVAQFTEMTAAAGFTGTTASPYAFGTGGAGGGLDGDGDMDYVHAANIGQPFKIYVNNGGTTTALMGTNPLGLVTAIVRSVTAGDLDNDGDQDLVVCNLYMPTQVFINHGGFVFTEEAVARGVLNSDGCYTAAFGDYDRDGWLDLYLGNYLDAATFPAANRLFRNLGNGFFQNVSVAAGVADTGFALAATFIDYDEDGWPDIYVGNDKGPVNLPNALYRNLGNGTFANVAAAVGANFVMDSMSIDFVDAFNDGGYDLTISDSPPHNAFAEFDSVTQTYTDSTYAYGLQGHGIICWFSKFLDYNNDGWQDLNVVQGLQRPLLYRNPGTGSGGGLWPEVGLSMGLSAPYAKHSASTVDLDDDGRVDLIYRYGFGGVQSPPSGLGYYRNTSPSSNWLKIGLVGNQSNRDGFGAHIRLTAGTITPRQQVRSGTGYLSNCDPRVHFGLGTATMVDRLEIRWPSGIFQVLYDVPANQILRVEEPRVVLQGSLANYTGSLSLHSSAESGQLGLLGIALATAPGIPLPGGRTVPLAYDLIFQFAANPGNALLPLPFGPLSASGTHSSPLIVPLLPTLSGLTFYASAATYNPLHGVGTTFPSALSITIP